MKIEINPLFLFMLLNHHNFLTQFRDSYSVLKDYLNFNLIVTHIVKIQSSLKHPKGGESILTLAAEKMRSLILCAIIAKHLQRNFSIYSASIGKIEQLRFGSCTDGCIFLLCANNTLKFKCSYQVCNYSDTLYCADLTVNTDGN
jgi:hypothetical protein